MSISSIKCHFNELLVLLNISIVNLHIVVLYETWLLNDLNFIINGYQSLNSLAVNNKSDGVTIFIKNRYQVKNVCTNLMSNSIELKFYINGIHYVVTGCYSIITIKYVTNNTSNNSKNTVHSLINNEDSKRFELFLIFLMISFPQQGRISKIIF